MILSIGLGVAALLAATWGMGQRAAAMRCRAEQVKALAAIPPLTQARDEAAAALAEARVAWQGVEAMLAEAQTAIAQRDAALKQANASVKRGLAEVARRDAELATAREAAAEASREHQSSLDRALTQTFSLRKTLASVSAERDRLARAVEEGAALAARAEADASERSALQERLGIAEAELARVRRESSSGPSRAWVARMGELEASTEALKSELARAEARATAAERARAAQGAPGGFPEREALHARVKALEAADQSGARTRAAVAALGLPELPRDTRIFSGERRGRSEAILRETYIATVSAGAAILDARGAPWARCGNPLVLERLGASAVLLARAPVTAALGQPARLFSELYGVYGRHLIDLPGTGLRLALTGSRECPALALRLAALKLVGPSTDPLPEETPDADLALDPQRSERLDAWAARRGAVGMAVFGLGEPAGTDSAFAAACAPLVNPVQYLFRRALRDGFAQGFAAMWRAQSDETLVARVLDDADAVVFARFASPPAPRVLDDLVATVRWSDARLAKAS